MDTAPLKSFATSARIELIREVGARITAVLAPGSPERVEQPGAVTALERTIAAGGGGDKGKVHVADKVAYTWFNRIIALRFMDANGYTGIGVVSPATGQVGQPGVLAAAKHGQIDGDVVKGANVATITALLNGTRQPRPGVDAQAEAYALLLADYCRYWNRTMPFMFGREGDYTELLLPANLLAEDSVLNRSVKVLTEEVCQDVEVIGWLYQFYISERKDEVFVGFKKNQKAGADEIPAATQLFTPHWIVRYLVENSVGRLWMLNRPESRLVDQMDYYIAPVDEGTDFLKITTPEGLTVIDPACGSGHMLTYAFDLLYAIYEEEGYAPSQIPGLILTHNLYGTEIDPRAGALAAFALTMKARAKQRTFFNTKVELNICVIEPISFGADELDLLVTNAGDKHAEETFWNQFAGADSLGALIQPSAELTARLSQHVATLEDRGDLLTSDVVGWAERCLRQARCLSDRYAIVVTNPPYMGSGNMDGFVTSWVKESFPNEKQDLYGCFVTRCSRLATDRGLVAMVTGDTWMTIKSFEKFRRDILSNCTFETFIHMRDVSNHADIFGANAAFVFAKVPTHHQKGTFVYLDSNSEEGKRQNLLQAVRDPEVAWSYRIEPEQFDAIPGAPIAFRLSAPMREAFSKGQPLGSRYDAMNGMTTGENARFLRLWHEVAASRTCWSARNAQESVQSGAKWFPYNKGGLFRKWFGNAEYVINWKHDGHDVIENGRAFTRGRKFYFRPMVSWAKVSSGQPAFRYYPAGFLFDVAGTAMFGESDDALLDAIAFCNSVVARTLLGAISPTLNYESGQIATLPVLIDDTGRVREIARELVAIARDDWNRRETSWDFTTLDLLAEGPTSKSLSDSLRALDASDRELTSRAQYLEEENNRLLAEAYGVLDDADVRVVPTRVSLFANPTFMFGVGKSETEYDRLSRARRVADLVSFAVGCMFGRYSLDEPGLILADQGATLQDYLAKVPSPTFTPDADNVIPIVDGDWFEDDIVERFRQFLRAAFGEQYFEENLRFVIKSLSVKNLRDYFVKSFIEDHIQRYKKRPIYWLFSSPNGSFNALIYMHRYTPSTVSTVLTYLREYVTKLESALQRAERAGNAKEADRLRKILVELNEYEHDTLFPKASENVVIDLDDGVKANYPKFGAALKRIRGLEAASD